MVFSTGMDKSLCYQLPAFLYHKHSGSICLVVSPLVSLMEDQVFPEFPLFLPHVLLDYPKKKLGIFPIPASQPSPLPQSRLHPFQPLPITAGSGHGKGEKKFPKFPLFFLKIPQRINPGFSRFFQQVRNGQAQILLLSPEAVVASGSFSRFFRDRFPRVAFACLDEAHCISQRSHNFRPAYFRVCEVPEREKAGKTSGKKRENQFFGKKSQFGKKKCDFLAKFPVFEGQISIFREKNPIF